MNTSSLYQGQSPCIRTPLDISNYSLGTKRSQTSHTTQTHKYNTVSGVSSRVLADSESPPPGFTVQTSPASAQSPSVSPVNSNYSTAAGQSTDCSVSVSGSDHELISESLQVLVLPPPNSEAGPRPEPKPRKIPPAVPN